MITFCLLCKGRRLPGSRQLHRGRFTCDVDHLAVTVGLELVSDGVALLHGFAHSAALGKEYGLMPSMAWRKPRTTESPAFLAAS
jgi:hypothetical protein